MRFTAFAIVSLLALAACQPVQLPAQQPKSCDVTIGGEVPRFGALPVNARQIFDAVSIAADQDSLVYDTRTYSDAWIEVRFSGMAAGTNAVAKLEFLHGTGDLAADLLPLPIVPSTMITSGSLPAGITLDAGADGLDISADFETNARLFFVMRNVPPKLMLRFDRTSGGSGATISSEMYLQ